MSSVGDITRWLRQLKRQDRDALQKLWEGYFPRLVGLARQRLRHLPGGRTAAEDVALSAFDSFWRGVEQGRFPRLEDRDDLWQVLVLIAARKACDLIQYEKRDKRDWRRSESLAPALDDGMAEGAAFQELISREPDPAFAAQVAEECRRLLDRLPDEQLRQIALWKMEGYTNEEIAPKLDVALATVQRRLDRIRRTWQDAGLV